MGATLSRLANRTGDRLLFAEPLGARKLGKQSIVIGGESKSHGHDNMVSIRYHCRDPHLGSCGMSHLSGSPSAASRLARQITPVSRMALMTITPPASTTAVRTDGGAAPSAYLRHPDLHDDLVVFCAADDIWAADLPTTEGPAPHARRLTDDGVPVSYPRISPDGAHVAFTSSATGAPEVHVVSTDGSADARRLTYWGNRSTRVAGWLEDGRILVTTGHRAPNTQRDAQLWALDLDGGADLLPFGRAGEMVRHSSGVTVVVTPWRKEPAHWKHYQGGTAARLWVSREDVPLDAPLSEHAQRTWEPLRDDLLASKTRLAFIGDRLVFASDTPGEGASLTDRASGNLWSIALDGTDLRRHTDIDSADGYLRDPAVSGERIVFTSRGRLFVKDSLDAPAREVPVQVSGVGASRRPSLADPAHALIAARPTRDARASVIEWRGSAHVLTHRGGPARLLAGQCGLRIREASPLGGTGYAVFVTDELAQSDRAPSSADAAGAGGAAAEPVVGSDALGVRRLDASSNADVFDLGDVGRILHAVPSADGRRVAISSHDGTVRVVDLDHAGEGADLRISLGGVRNIAHSTGGEVADLAISPDSRWLVWSEPNSWHLSRLMIADLEEKDPVGRPLTSGAFREAHPAFSADGKHLAFVSSRTLDTVYDDLVFDLAFVNAQRPHLLPLDRTTEDPFGPRVDGWAATAAEAKPDEAGSASGRPGADGAAAMRTDGTTAPTGPQSPVAAPTTTVHLDGAEQRILPFPVESGRISQLQAVKDGFVWLRHPQETVIGSTRAGVEGEAPKPTLEMWNLKDRRLLTLAEGVDQVEASGDGEHLVIRQGDALVQIPSARTTEEDDPARIEIDTSRLRLMVDPVAERLGMLWDNYRIMAQQFWRADMDGQDWHAMTSWYEDVVPRLVTQSDVVDMMWEVVGELGTSHAYVAPAEVDVERPPMPGLLGAELVRDGDAWVIERILTGDSSDPASRCPILAPGVAAQVGDRIVQVDGRDVDPAQGPAPLLVGTADRPTELVLERPGATGADARRRVVVVPTGDEHDLRYQSWVQSRREFVAERSGGRLGYLHIPDMMSGGWAQMHRDLRAASEKEGIVVDVRYNSGGHTSQLVTDRLARRVVSWDYPRHQEPGTYPAFAPRGPIALVTNQDAGSDGDIVNAVSQAMGIGPVIGTRTWGGVIGIDGRFDLVDGTGITQPKYASWFEGKDWGIENYGVDPDIEVPIPPNAWVAGEDPQLARGVDEVLAALTDRPAAVAPPLPPARYGGGGAA